MTSLDTPIAHDGLRTRLPRRDGQRQQWSGLHGSAVSLALWRAAAAPTAGMVLVIAETPTQARLLESELGFYGAGRPPAVLAFPDWETLPYDVFSPHQDIVSERLRTLAQLPATNHGLLVVPINTLLQRLPPAPFVAAHVLELTVGQPLELGKTRRLLEQAGYRCVPEVGEHGEFAVRGSVLDLYPMGSDEPIRVDLFDDEIETIRGFDPETQLGTTRHTHVSLLPGREFPVDDAAIGRFRAGWRASFEGDPTRSRIYQSVSDGNLPGGVEAWLPLFHTETATLFDYLPQATTVFLAGTIAERTHQIWGEITARYEQRRHDADRPLLAPERLYMPANELLDRIDACTTVQWAEEDAAALARGPAPGIVRHPTRPLPPLALDPGSRDTTRTSLDALLAGLDADDAPTRVLFVAETSGHRETLLDALRLHAITPPVHADFAAFEAGDDRYGIVVSPMDQGAWIPPADAAAGLLVITEAELYPNRVQQRRRRRRAAQDPAALIRDLTALQLDAPVVHEEHGVGRYRGLQRLDVGACPTEFLILEYADAAKLYVPVASLHLITRYTGGDPEHAPLHRLGSGQWEKARSRAAKRVRDVAAELLDVYARRAARRGVAMDGDSDAYQRFAAAFAYEETPDQADAINAVLADLASEQPMDRVVCGDVGFGKTEVAMRAAFVAVQSGYQVIVLVPTTLLAGQHDQSFRDRFADWPVTIAQMSRFVDAKTRKETVAGLADGRVDIVIGTHQLLQSTLSIKRLGLVIIDEEQRFGVRQKERLKSLRAEVDILTLTATPIPRTLNMALAGIRDLSLITTPPARRLAVKTFVSEWDDGLIEEACLREFKRGGQVYFLHNDVQSIERMADRLGALLPQASIGIAHGQLPERELEQAMLDFYHQRLNLLVCSTIIESGIDIPSANTIIINRADRFGLAQLHQLRGRVGRSHHRAYAYLIRPVEAVMTPEARRRLLAIAAHEDLGAGFNLASHDLEIRGAGELLGAEQSGEITEVGFTFYNRLLERAVRDLRSGKVPELDGPLSSGCEVELHIPALLPDDYLPDVHARLVLYRRIAVADDHAALRALQVEMIDRFGLLPEPAKNLFACAELRLRAGELDLRRIDIGDDGGMLVFGDPARIDAMRLVRLIQQAPQHYRLDGDERLRILIGGRTVTERIRLVETVIDALQGGNGTRAPGAA